MFKISKRSSDKSKRKKINQRLEGELIPLIPYSVKVKLDRSIKDHNSSNKVSNFRKNLNPRNKNSEKQKSNKKKK